LQHHRDQVRFEYSCFDRMILHGSIRSFQHTACGGTVRWFCAMPPPAPGPFAGIANAITTGSDQFAADRHLDILHRNRTPTCSGLPQDLVEPHFQTSANAMGSPSSSAGESERIAWLPRQTNDIAIRRATSCSTTYLNDRDCGRMFLASARTSFRITVWLNATTGSAPTGQRSDRHQTCDNLFTACQRPERCNNLACFRSRTSSKRGAVRMGGCCLSSALTTPGAIAINCT
jgi:hypothetical protein